MSDELEYHSWERDERNIREAQWRLPHEKYTKRLHDIYDRKLVIIEEILQDLSPQLNDPQYCGTTSWGYEKELAKLNARQEKLEPAVEKRMEAIAHKEMLEDMGMTQEQYDAHLQEEEKQRKLRFQNRLRKLR